MADETPGLVEREIERRLQRAEGVANEARRLGAWAGDAHRGEAAQQRGDVVARNILLVWKRDLTWAANTIESLHKERDELRGAVERFVNWHDEQYADDLNAGREPVPQQEAVGWLRSTLQGTGDQDDDPNEGLYLTPSDIDAGSRSGTGETHGP